MTIDENGTTSANSDVLQHVIAFDGLSSAERDLVLQPLLRHATGVENKAALT